MLLKQVQINQFKNHNHFEVAFESQFTTITGLNGRGKTNFLDAIHHLAFTKSYFKTPDRGCVQHGCEGYKIQGLVHCNNNDNEIIIKYLKSKSKKILINEQQKKSKDIIGMLPLLFSAPEDTEIIRGSGSSRRKFIDKLISLFDLNYLENITKYYNILNEKNQYLKNTYPLSQSDSLLDTYDEQLIVLGKHIATAREAVINKLTTIIKDKVKVISSNYDFANIEYVTDLFDDTKKVNRQLDILSKRTNYGIHKDEIHFMLNDMLTYRSSGSQGQLKTLLLAIYLSSSELLYEKMGVYPILLLDDFLSKFDDERVDVLFKEVFCKIPNQTIITDTQKEKLKHKFKHYTLDCMYLHL